MRYEITNPCCAGKLAPASAVVRVPPAFMGFVRPMASSPAFQFYPDDFLGSGKVGAMTPGEVGIYVFLLCLDWNETGFAYNPKRLARFCRTTEDAFAEAWEIVGECFTERAGRWYNPRLEREREKQEKFRQKQVAAGIASAAARFNRGSTVVQPTFNSPFPSPALATTGRSRAKSNGHDPPPYVPAVPIAPPFCAHCGGEPTHNEKGRIVGLRHKQGCPG